MSLQVRGPLRFPIRHWHGPHPKGRLLSWVGGPEPGAPSAVAQGEIHSTLLADFPFSPPFSFKGVPVSPQGCHSGVHTFSFPESVNPPQRHLYLTDTLKPEALAKHAKVQRPVLLRCELVVYNILINDL